MAVGEARRKAEQDGAHPARAESPLLSCPSIMDPAVALTENLEDVA